MKAPILPFTRSALRHSGIDFTRDDKSGGRLPNDDMPAIALRHRLNIPVIPYSKFRSQ